MFYLIETRKTQAFCASRQVGKTYGLAGAAYSWSITKPDSLTLIVSTGENHAKEILDRARTCFQKSKLNFTFSKDSEEEIRLKGNGSRIVSRPSNPKTVRGYSPDLLIIDEAAAIEHWGYMQASLFPSVSQTGGTIIVTSTFAGKNHFWEMMTQPEWNGKVYPWWVNPSPEIETFKRILPPEQFMEEFECIPVDEGWSLFPLELIESCTVEHSEEWLL